MNTSPRRRKTRLSREERRENALRPDPRLGYDWDSVGLHLVSREAYGPAEVHLRRAVWLNPYEPVFKQHLAWCLFLEAKYAEAKEWAVLAQTQADSSEVRTILDLIEHALADGGP